jgi:Methyltransferase domain
MAPVCMVDVEERIESLDVSLFEAVPSQSYPEDRKSLLLLQRCLRRRGTYTYLEIGSHLGGTLQSHLVDGRCQRIYSIDKRPIEQADEYSGACYYPGNSTHRMLDGLQAAYPDSSIQKIETFDADAREIDPAAIPLKPEFCFIDGEHTDKAVASDFNFCLKVCHPDGIIAFHDANVITDELMRIKRRLNESKVRFRGFLLPRHVYVILLNGAIDNAEIEAASIEETRYMREARWELLKARVSRRYPALQKIWHASKRLVGASSRSAQ